MTLKDFFTLSELNNGLTAPSRVTDLVAIMEKEIDSFGGNISDVIKHWSTVARAISATDNKDCLDLFVQINGLNCIAKWLNHTQKLVNEESDSSIEDAIVHFLRAVEAFHIGREKLINSEIWTTVTDLVVHYSPKVCNGARVLLEKWEKKAESSISLLENEKAGALNGNEAGEAQDVKKTSEQSESSLGNTHLSKETSAEEEKLDELTKDETLLSANNVVVEDGGDGLGNLEPEKPILGQPHSTGTTLIESCSPSVPMELPSCEESNPHEGTSVTEIVSKNSGEESLQVGLSTFPDGKFPVNGSGDSKECDVDNMARNSSITENRVENLKGFRSFPVGIEVDGKTRRRDLFTSGCDLATSYGLGKKHTDRDDAAKKSSKEPDYGIVDPLEVARQVAFEVEREVVDYRGQSCNSSEKSPKKQPDSPESVRGETLRVSDDDSPDETKSYNSGSDEDSKMEEDSSSVNSGTEQRNESQDMAISPQVAEAARTEIDAEKVPCGFDLNEISLEDVENDRAIPSAAAPFSMVSASRPTAAHGLPTVPLQFEGSLGWKGSAATSAFRPASPRRVTENERQLYGGESSGSKKAESFLDFDLNVAENADHRETFPDMNSRKSEHLGVDLNSVTESFSGGPREWLFGKLLPHQSTPHSSSSSKQPISFIDLNDQPSFDAFGTSKSKEGGFSIFGARVEAGPKDNVPQFMSSSNGQMPELALNATSYMGQTRSVFGMPPPMVQYNNSSAYGYNNIQSGQAMRLSSAAMYGSVGPIPYMVDYRGSPMVPQIVGSSSAFPNPFSQPPFVVNASSSNPSNGAGPSWSSFDLNSGSMAESSISRDTSSFGQFLNLGQVSNNDPQAPKRKEPENGLENYGLRPYTPPWK